MNETSTAAATEAQPAKSIFKSKTAWLNLVTLVSSFVPMVQTWLAENPVEIISVFAAVNILVRFVTKGRVSLFSGNGNPGHNGAVNLVAVGAAAGLVAIAMGALVSCDGMAVSGSAYYRDDESGAKGGMRFEPGAPPIPWFRVPVETETGSGFIDIEGGRVDRNSGK